jgi:transposase-like protein
MKTPVWIIALALNCYYEGMSLGAIQREINQRHGAYYAQSSIYNWITRFSEEAIRQAKPFQPKVGDIWLLCSTPVRTGHRRLWFVDIFDMNSKFLLASQLSETGTEQEAIGFINLTHFTTKKTLYHPVTVIPSGTFDSDEPTRKVNESELPDNLILRKADKNSMAPFDKLLKKRNDVVHSFKSIKKAQTLTDAWRLHYNFLAGNDTTGHTPPAQKMGKTPFKNWKDIISQSTSKIIYHRI